MENHIGGASVWEQNLYSHLIGHVQAEQGAIVGYRDAAEKSSSPAFSYLTKLILEDEQRHHRMMMELAESLRKFAELAGEPTPVPLLDHPANAAELLAATERMLEVEKNDHRELKQLHKELSDVGSTTLWQLIVDIMQHDTDKHIAILEFTRKWLRSV